MSGIVISSATWIVNKATKLQGRHLNGFFIRDKAKAVLNGT
jgi:hypothetical protein